MEGIAEVLEAIDRFKDPVAGDELPGFQILEGFARLTRDGVSDIFLILNRASLGSRKFSIAYSFDDFVGESKSCGHTWFVEETDVVEHLGGVREYLTLCSPADAWKGIVLRQFEREVGFLPFVRACENLRSLGRTPTVDEIRIATQTSLADYRQRRQMLSILERN